MAYTVWSDYGCRKKCEDCKDGPCEKHQDECCCEGQQGYACCDDDDDEEEGRLGILDVPLELIQAVQNEQESVSLWVY